MTVPQRLSISAQLSNCNLAKCWHIKLIILGLLHLSIGINLSLHKSPSAKTRMQTHRSNLDCTTLRLRQPWEELVPWEGTPWHWSKHLNFRPSWLFHKGCLSLHSWQTSILPHEWLSKPLLTLKWDHPTCEMSLRFLNFRVFLGIMGYRSGILRLEFLAFLSAIRIEKTIEKNGNRESGIAFEISHRFTGFWHLMTGDIMNQTSEVLTDAHMLARWTQHTGSSPPSKCTANLVSRMCLSNSDFEVQSAGYNSAQSPTNWESIHGKDPSIFCRASSRISIALDDKTQNAKSKIVDWHKKLCTNPLDTKCFFKDSEKLLSTQLQFLWDQGAKRREPWDVPDWFRSVNFRCVRWCHHKTVLYLTRIYCRNEKYTCEYT